MIITCIGCKTRFRVDEIKIPNNGKRIKCPKCTTELFIQRPEHQTETAQITPNFTDKPYHPPSEEQGSLIIPQVQTRSESQILEAILDELTKINQELKLLRHERTPNQQQKILQPSSSQSIASQPEVEESIDISTWFSSKGTTLKGCHQTEQSDTSLNKVSKALGENYAVLSEFYDMMKRTLSMQKSININLASKDSKIVTALTNFCNLLKQHKLFSTYTYEKKTRTITATFTTNAEVTKFFTGGWFERYIYWKVTNILSQQGIKYKGILNAEIILPDQASVELDIFFLVQGGPLWIECKTGNWIEYISKYTEIRKILSIPKQRAILGVLDLPENITHNLTNFFEMTLANQYNIADKLEHIALELKNAKLPASVAWQQFINQYHVNDTLDAVITNITPMGLFLTCDREMGVKGLLHKSNLPNDFTTRFETGQVINVQIKMIKYEKQQVEFVLGSVKT